MLLCIKFLREFGVTSCHVNEFEKNNVTRCLVIRMNLMSRLVTGMLSQLVTGMNSMSRTYIIYLQGVTFGTWAWSPGMVRSTPRTTRAGTRGVRNAGTPSWGERTNGSLSNSCISTWRASHQGSVPPIDYFNLCSAKLNNSDTILSAKLPLASNIVTTKRNLTTVSNAPLAIKYKLGSCGRDFQLSHPRFSVSASAE